MHKYNGNHFLRITLCSKFEKRIFIKFAKILCHIISHMIRENDRYVNSKNNFTFLDQSNDERKGFYINFSSFVLQPTGAVYWTELQSLHKQLHSSSHFVNIEFHVFLRLGKIYFYIQRCQIRYFAEFLLREHFIFRSIQLMKILRR